MSAVPQTVALHADNDTLWLSDATVVGVQKISIGLFVPADDLEDECDKGLSRLVLDHGDLLVLAELSNDLGSIAAALDRLGPVTEATGSDFQPFIDRLRDFGLLVADPPLRLRIDPPTEMGAVPDVADDRQLVLATPLTVLPRSGRFVAIDHEGRERCGLSASELDAAFRFGAVATWKEALSAHRKAIGAAALPAEPFHDLICRLVAVGLLKDFDPNDPVHLAEARQVDKFRHDIARRMRIRRHGAMAGESYAESKAALDTRVSHSTMTVAPVSAESWNLPPAALGYLMAYGRSFEGGRLQETFGFHDRFFTKEDLAEIPEEPAIYLFSNYVWNIDDHLELSARVKAANPANITIHGGPSTPKYEVDSQQFFRDHRHVDVTVHGEGEQTFVELLAALEPSVQSGALNLDHLNAVDGLSYREGVGAHRTPDRDRISDLDVLPSPILSGLFDQFAAGPCQSITLETNRGCPYGCTFCDWGSATLSRIRKFDIERIFAEIEWAGRNKIEIVGIADANFGIFDRDVAIAEKVVEVKEKYGFPTGVGPNYAKNTVKHLRKIIEIWADAGILTDGKVSLQSMDEDTLHVIRRKNIKTEKYDQLAVEFQQNQLPLTVDLMMGLPGASLGSFKNDLQEFINRDVRPVIHATTLLPNSPMNDVEYKQEHGIVAEVNYQVRQTNTFSRADWGRMQHLRSAAYVFDMCAVGRYAARYLRSEVGRKEIDFYDDIIGAVLDDPDSWPMLGFVMRSMEALVPPGSWKLYIDELRRFIIETYDLDPADSSLGVALQVQLAHLPDATRSFPDTLHLEHDFVSWHNQLLAMRVSGHKNDWQDQVPKLSEFGPGTLRIEDPQEVSTSRVGAGVTQMAITFMNWELASPVSRLALSGA